MAAYGVTPNGLNIKRLDVILGEMQDDLTDALGFNVRQNPQSFLNVLLTSFADKIAELWEYGAQVYHSEYPSSASDQSLDYAAQYSGITREQQAPSYYPLLCTGVDGTVLYAGTRVATDLNPETQLVLNREAVISRSSFSRAVIRLATTGSTGTFTIILDEKSYNFAAADVLPANDIFTALAAKIPEPFSCSVSDGMLTIEADDMAVAHSLALSENMTTQSVTSTITFATVENGDICLPSGSVTRIITGINGFTSVTNSLGYIAGRLRETDAEFRQSYADKIFLRSSRMVESIRSAILANVQGVTSCRVFENDTNEVDDMGRWPHSVEIVADGGDSYEIAQQILNTKAGGINTFGSIAVTVPGLYGEDITIRFNRPVSLYIWFQVTLTLSETETVTSNYADLIRKIILNRLSGMEPGATVAPQKNFYDAIYSSVSGIEYVDIYMFSSEDVSAEPESYPLRSIRISDRQKAVSSTDRIQVVIADAD